MTSPNYYFRWDADWFWNIPTDAGGWLVHARDASRSEPRQLGNDSAL